MCTYLSKREATYYFRFPIPVALRGAMGGKAEIMQSLRTKDREKAKRLIPAHTLAAQRLLDEAASRMAKSQQSAPEDSPPPLRARGAAMEQAVFEQGIEAAEVLHDQLEADNERRAIRKRAVRLEEKLLASSTEELSPLYGEIKRLLAEKDFDLRLANEQIAALSLGLKVGQPISDDDAKPISAANSKTQILTMFDAYAEAKNVSLGFRADWRKNVQRLIDFLGHDDASRLTANNLRDWRQLLLSETTNRGTLRNANTVRNGYLGAVKAMLNWAVDEQLLPLNVALGVTVHVPRQISLRADKGFTDAEAKAILAAALTPAPSKMANGHARARRWIPWICAYTGARVNELSQLRKEDVKQTEGIWTVRITPEAGTVKGGKARMVPIHLDLIEQGFLSMVEAQPAGPIFFDPESQRTEGPANRHYKKVGERLAVWVRDTVGITDKAIKPNHAWRHRFKSKAMDYDIPERIADAIQGHAASTVGQKYGHPSISALAAAIYKIPSFKVGTLSSSFNAEHLSQ